jgi:hypothetical protein
LGTKDNRGAKPKNPNLKTKLEKFYESEYEPLNNQKISLKNMTQLIEYLATQIVTCFNNNIKEHFVQHFNRFLHKTLNLDKPIQCSFKHSILNLKTENRFPEWQETHLPKILPAEIEKSVYYDLEIDPSRYLKGMIYMNSILEQQGSKLFQFCPNINKNKDLIWGSFFKTSDKAFRYDGYNFYHQIQTDGISVSLLFVNEKEQQRLGKSRTKNLITNPPKNIFQELENLSDDQIQDYKQRNVVGCDPGKRSIVYMVDTQGRKLQYTSDQRKFESKSKRNAKVLLNEKVLNRISEMEKELSSHNSKIIDYQKFKDYIKEKHILNKKVSDFYERELWRKMKFRKYCYGRKSLDAFLDKIQETFGMDILIGYGNWSRKTQMKNFVPTMGKGMREIIDKRFDTVTVHEYNTSKKCCNCHSDLHYYYNVKKRVYRLLYCSECVRSETKRVIFRARDWNASVNIRNITKEWLLDRKRPTAFTRSHVPDHLPDGTFT